MLILWRDSGQERAARFTSEAEARQFCEQLRTRHGAQNIELVNDDGVSMTANQP